MAISSTCGTFLQRVRGKVALTAFSTPFAPSCLMNRPISLCEVWRDDPTAVTLYVYGLINVAQLLLIAWWLIELLPQPCILRLCPVCPKRAAVFVMKHRKQRGGVVALLSKSRLTPNNERLNLCHIIIRQPELCLAMHK